MFNSPDDLQDWLIVNGIDLSLWDKENAKSVENLWREIEAGETRLEGQPPMRLVQVAEVIIRNGDQVLIEVGQLFGNGRFRKRHIPPSEKFKTNENYLDAVYRCLAEELLVSKNQVTLLPNSYKVQKKEKESASYPTLMACYQVHSVEVKVEGLPEGDFSTDNQSFAEGDPVAKHFWSWQDNG